jgi:hypothetical protein
MSGSQNYAGLQMIAYAGSMLPNLAMAAVILAIGTMVLFWMPSRQPAPTSKSRSWIPLAALAAGLAITVLLWVAAVAFNPEADPHISDRWALLPPMLLIGTFVGVIASAVFAVALRLRPSGDSEKHHSP